jgi:hypothetical protein
MAENIVSELLSRVAALEAWRSDPKTGLEPLRAQQTRTEDALQEVQSEVSSLWMGWSSWALTRSHFRSRLLLLLVRLRSRGKPRRTSTRYSLGRATTGAPIIISRWLVTLSMLTPGWLRRLRPLRFRRDGKLWRLGLRATF